MSSIAKGLLGPPFICDFILLNGERGESHVTSISILPDFFKRLSLTLSSLLPLVST